MRLTALVLVSAVALTGCEVNLNTQGISVRDVKSFKVTGQPELALDTFDGAIELHSWDKNEIEVEVEKRAMEQSLIDEMKIDAQQQGDRITVKVTGPAKREHGQFNIGVHISPTARMRVAVPRNINLNVLSGDGSIKVEAVEGHIVLHTTDGSVTGTRLGGDIQIRSGDGTIRLTDTTGALDLETTDGSIGVDARPTVLRARTGDGSIRATIQSDTTMADNWELTTSDGNVTVTLPRTFNTEVDAETSDGVVRANHPMLSADDSERHDRDSREERREHRRSLRTKMGEGGKILRIRTGDGSIRIER